MKYSLLHKVEEVEKAGNVIYDLSIDRAIANISNDSRRNDYFCNVVSKPLCIAENIEYRRQILNDFIVIPGLLDACRTVFNRYDKLKTDWLELKGQGDMGTSDKGSEAMLDYTYSSLKVTALFPKTIMSFFYTINETLGAFELRAPGLTAIRDYAGAMLGNESLREIVDVASLFMYNTPQDYDFEIVCTLTDTLEVCNSQISGITKREKEKQNLFKKLSKKKKPLPGTVESVAEPAREDALYVLGESLYHIDDLLEEITSSIYSTFYGISRELDFYDVAKTYVQYIKEHSPSACFAKMGEAQSGAYNYSQLYDLFLMSEGKENLIPNDVCFDDFNGALIKGRNNTGKTTFLRALGTAQLFSQAGLPIPAKDAELPCFAALFTHFSSAEEDFVSGDTSGRFEGEVKAVSEIIENLIPGSLILLNETFQTTAYDEGTKAMSSILKVFVKTGSRFVFVTHLTDLFDIETDRIIKLESGGENPYIIKPL